MQTPPHGRNALNRSAIRADGFGSGESRASAVRASACLVAKAPRAAIVNGFAVYVAAFDDIAGSVANLARGTTIAEAPVAAPWNLGIRVQTAWFKGHDLSIRS